MEDFADERTRKLRYDRLVNIPRVISILEKYREDSTGTGCVYDGAFVCGRTFIFAGLFNFAGAKDQKKKSAQALIKRLKQQN
jgi:hypothetical protein